jgi:hypothetical protein
MELGGEPSASAAVTPAQRAPCTIKQKASCAQSQSGTFLQKRKNFPTRAGIQNPEPPYRFCKQRNVIS